MITLTKLDGERLVLNAELIESIMCGTDTMISLTTGRKLIVRETPDAVVALVLEYRMRCGRPPVPGQPVPGD